MTLTPPPDPMPPTWNRAIANDIAERLTHDGWGTADQLRAWSFTGNPSGHRYHTPGSIPGVLPTTELLARDLYVWGTIDPNTYPGFNIPPLAYILAQLDLAQAITNREDATTLMHAAQGWLAKCRRSDRTHRTTPHVYRAKPNRHGNHKLQRNDYALPAEAEAFLIAAGTATVRVLDHADYADAMYDPTFPATTALQIIEAASGYALQ